MPHTHTSDLNAMLDDLDWVKEVRGTSKYPALVIEAPSPVAAAFNAAKFCHSPRWIEPFDPAHNQRVFQPPLGEAILDEVKETEDPNKWVVIVEAY